MLPNLLVIGASKCGTTSLHHYLGLHPEIGMSRVKELHYFVEEPTESSLRWYASQFPDAPVRGESSPSYTQRHRSPLVAARIARVLPDVKLVYIVRDPVERLLSSYRFHRYDLGSPVGTLEEFIDEGRPLGSSRFGFQLESYLEHFPRERILVLEHRDLAERRAETLRTAFGFLGVDESFTSPRFDERLNQTGNELHANALGRTVLGVLPRALGPRTAQAIRARVPRSVIRPLLRQADAPPLEVDPALRARLEAELKPDADRFRELTGMRFESWSV